MKRPSPFFFFTIVFVGLMGCQPPKMPLKKPLEIINPPIPRAEVPSQERIKIGIRIDVDSVTIGCDTLMLVKDLVSGEESDWGAASYVLSARKGRVYVDQDRLGQKIRFRSSHGTDVLKCRGMGYRGDLVVIAAEDKLTVINETGIDDYLAGVLPREVVMSWHEEALKVQAVASRTYLASHLGSHNKQGFDLCSDVHCQVYGGVAKEHPRTTEAVASTKGEILVYGGKPIGAFFHSNCGGSTEEISHVWGPVDQPFLPRKKCNFGTADPRYNWKISFSFPEILEALIKKTDVKGTQLKSLKIKKKSLSGRAEKITVVTDQGSFDLKGNSFRIAMHPERIRSTLFTSVTRHGNAYEFEGRGWGHGVGMCQWGAKGQAERGILYREILDFYYPNSHLEIWSR